MESCAYGCRSSIALYKSIIKGKEDKSLKKALKEKCFQTATSSTLAT